MMLSPIAKMARLDTMPLSVFAKNEQVKKRNNKQLEQENQQLKKALKAQEERHRLERINLANQAVKATYAKTNQAKFNRWTVRISKADEAFSLAVRLRANCRCEHCGQTFSPDNMKDLHCAHYYGRENPNVRFHPLNAFALCKGCHLQFDRFKKAEFTHFVKSRLNEWDYLKLTSAANVPKQLIDAKKEKKITAWFNLIARQLKILRLTGDDSDYEIPDFDNLFNEQMNT